MGSINTSIRYLILLLPLLLQVVHGCDIQGGTWQATVSGSEAKCTGDSSCKGATITNCDTVTCETRDCWEATMVNVTNVFCNGNSACYNASIGTKDSPATTVTCRGPEWTCYLTKIFASNTVICEDDGTTVVSDGPDHQGVCAFSTVEATCLQCLGVNHGCEVNCKLSGEDCPVCQCGGVNCTADICIVDGENCPGGAGGGGGGGGGSSAFTILASMWTFGLGALFALVLS